MTSTPRHRRRTPALLVLSTVLALLGADASLASSDESIPNAVLRAAGQEQRGHLWSSSESSGDGDGCVTGFGDGIPVPPRRGVALSRDPFRGRIRIPRDEQPRVRLDAYTELDEEGSIDFGSGQKVRFRLRAVPSTGDARAWVVRFRTRANEDVYLDLGASWTDPSGCGRDDASYLFHLERR